MRSVRCDACGNKAMLAASQCPHCGHLLELRDGFGQMLPLAHCSDCDSYYPAHQGTCKWCGTAPEGFRLAPYAVKGVGVLAFAGLVSAAWLANRSEETPEAELVSVPSETTTGALTTRVDSGVDFHPPVFAGIEDTASDFTPTATPVSVVAPNAEAEGSPASGPGDATTGITGPELLGASEMAPARVAAAKAPVRASRSARWVRATARRWVTVRASATHKSRIVASIGPQTRVQLGELRGDWRRIRMKGITGWVERGKF